MLPSLRSHNEYIKFVEKNLNDDNIPKAHDDVPNKLKLLDLTPFRLLSLKLYSSKLGRTAFAPEDMMRTFVAMTLCGITSPTDWTNKYLKDKSGFYAILVPPSNGRKNISGFQPGITPSEGCLYEFTNLVPPSNGRNNRILNIPKYCKEDHIRPKRKRLTRTQKNS